MKINLAPRRWLDVRPIFLFAATLAAVSPAHAVSGTWVGGTDANWSTLANWGNGSGGSIAGVPGSGNNATFNGAGGGFTTITTGTINIANITFDTSSAAAYTLGGASAGTGQLTLSNTLQVTSSVTNNEKINANLFFASTTTGMTVENDSTAATLTVAGAIRNISAGTGTHTLAVTGAGNTLLSGVLSDNGGGSATGITAVTKSGTGTLTMSNASSSYTGATTVAAGNLLLTGVLGSGSAVTVGNNSAAVAILSGTGTVNGTLATATTGSNIAYIAPGVNTSGTRGDVGVAGTLHVGTAGVSFGAGTNFDFDLASTAAGTSDLISMGGGTLTIGNALTFNINELTANTLQTGANYTLVSGFTNGSALSTTLSGTTFTTNGITGYTPTYSIVGNALDVSFALTVTNGKYTLTTTPASLNVHAGGGTTTLTTVLANTGTGTQDALNYSGVTATAGAGTVGTASGTTSGSNLARGTDNSPGATQTFTAGSTAGNVTIGNSATVTNASASGTPVATNTGATINVYSGLSTWTGTGTSGVWGSIATAFGTNWGTNQGSPGVTSGFTGVDTATFGAVSGNPATYTVSLNDAAPNLNSIAFNAASTSYTIAQGSGGNGITLSGTTPGISVAASGGSHTISAPVVLGADASLAVGTGGKLTLSGQVSGAHALSNTGAGTTVLSSANIYSGGTSISAGKFYVNGGVSGVSSGTGTGAVSVTGGTLAGTGNIATSSGVTIHAGGTLASGGAQSGTSVDGTHLTMTNTAVTLSGTGTGALSANLTFDLGAGNPTGAGFHTFANPNTSTTSLVLSGSSTLGFTAGSTESVSLVDLTNGALSLRLGTPFLLVQAASDLDYLNLVIQNGTTYTLSNVAGVDGYVAGVWTGVGLNFTPIAINQYGPDGTTQLSSVYAAPALYLSQGQLEVVPEPATWTLMLGGLAALGFCLRRKSS